MDLSAIKAIVIPEWEVKKIVRNGATIWEKMIEVGYFPIVTDDTSKFPLYLKGYSIITLNGGLTYNNRNVNRLWTSTWAGHDQLVDLPDTTLLFSNLYPYNNKALASVDNKTFSINRVSGKLNGNLILCDADVTENDTTANMSARWNAYLALHPMKLLIAGASDESLWFAVTDGTNYGYFNPTTNKFMSVYGMTGNVIKRVDYVSFDGSQYVDTGVALTGGDTVTVDFVNKKSGDNIFGSWRSSNTNVYTLYASTTSSYVRYNSSLYRNTPIPLNTRLTFKMTPTGDYVGNTRYHTWTQADFNTNTPCLVGWLNGSSSPHMQGDVYDFAIKDKSHLIPVKVGNNYYLFDCKKWKLPTHNGTLSGGQEVSENIPFPEEIPEETELLLMGGNPFYPSEEPINGGEEE